MTLARIAATTALLTLGSCTAPNPLFEPIERVCADEQFFVGQPFTLSQSNALDILFVVDDSPGMAIRQERLADAMPSFVDGLNAIDDLDWQLGVVSTDLSLQGALQVGTAESCPAAPVPVISRGTSNAGEVAACNVQLGEDGWDIEQGLEAAHRAIRGNAGFLRDDARRLIIFFADEDDCTALESLDRSDPSNCLRQPEALVDVQSYADFYASAAHPRSGSPLAIVAIVPPSSDVVPSGDEIEPSCDTDGPAFTGTRYRAVTSRLALSTPSFSESICTRSFSGVLNRALEEIVELPQDQLCLSLPAAAAPAEVIVSTAPDAPGTALIENEDYYFYGPTPGCSNGVLSIEPSAHGEDIGDRIEVRFCTTEDPAGT
ncbi:MAG: hypothetical protein ACI81R_000758 [Bradymonadia bacterium]|jgi:hypothetical protein